MKSLSYLGKIKQALRLLWTPHFFSAMILELIYIISTVGVLTLGYTLLIREMQQLIAGSVALTSGTAIESTAQAYSSFVTTIIIDSLALIVPLIVLWVAVRVGHQMIFQKWNKKSIWYATISSFLFALLSIVLVLLVLLLINSSVAGIALVVLFFVLAHFGWIHSIMSIRMKPIQSIRKSIHIGISKFHLLIVPYIIVAIIVGLLLSAASATGIVSALLYGILLSSLLAFSKIFLREFLDLLH